MLSANNTLEARTFPRYKLKLPDKKGLRGISPFTQLTIADSSAARRKTLCMLCDVLFIGVANVPFRKIIFH